MGLAPRVDVRRTVAPRKFPRNGEAVPSLRMGGWISLNVDDFTCLRRATVKVLKTVLYYGGTLVDPSPPYGFLLSGDPKWPALHTDKHIGIRSHKDMAASVRRQQCAKG